MSYLGRSPTVGTQRMLDSIESQFNGVLTTFDLRYGGVPTYPTLSASLIVSLGGVLQEPGEAYYVSSDKIVFSQAPNAGLECWILLYSQYGTGVGAAQNGTLGAETLVLTGQLQGPSNFIIDPAVVGDDTGTVEIKGNLTVQGTTTTVNSTTTTINQISLGDNDKALFGDGYDLQIYHDGSNSYIDDAGTGNLIIGAANLQIMNLAHNENYITATNNGQVELYYDNSLKFQTTNTGTLISGEGVFTQTTASPINDSLQIGFTSPEGFLKSKNSSASPASNLGLYTTDIGGITNKVVHISFDKKVSVNNPTAQSRFHIASAGDNFIYQTYERSIGGVDAKYWQQGIDVTHGFVTGRATDAGVLTPYLKIGSTGNVGIGTTNPTDKLHVIGNTVITGTLTLGLADSASAHINSYELMTFNIDSDNDDTNRYFAWHTNGPAGTGTQLLKLAESGELTPGADATQNLGSPSFRWANIYSADLQLSNEGSPTGNDVDGTWGAYTIQEGEEALYLINRRSGKKFKFVLEEVN